MAGILDFLQSPDAQLGIGLLAAGGPTTDPNRTGLGQRMAGAMQSVTANQSAMTDAQLKKAQLAEAQLKTQVDAYQLKRLQDWQNLVTGGGSPTGASPAVTAQASGVMPPTDGGMPPQQGDPQQPGMPQQAQAPARPGFPFALPGVGDQQSRAVAAILPPADYMKMYADKAGPQTDIAKMMVDAGIDRNTPLGRQLVQAAIAKANNVPPVSVRPGGYTLDNLTGVATQYPHVPDGSQAVPDGQGGWRIVPVQGGLAGMQAGASAKAMGEASAKPTVVYGADNKPRFSTQAQDVGRATGMNPAFQGLPPAQGGMTSSFNGPPEQVLPLIASMKDPQERANAYDAYSRQLTNGGPTQGAPAQEVTPQLAPGQEKGATLGQEELSGKYKELAAANSSAPTVISRLQNIKMLAPGAITGAETSRRDFFNGLLSLAGIKGAEDSKTASDLVDKNSSQIVSALRMGQGGAGTDALQTLLGAANPNRHMTAEAINEAADQLIASQKMNQAKAKLLTPVALARDPQTYGAKELAFDQAADPRIWQWQSISDPKARKAFAASVMKNDPSFPQKIQTLEQMGALK